MCACGWRGWVRMGRGGGMLELALYLALLGKFYAVKEVFDAGL
jgi:hypothetical protein